MTISSTEKTKILCTTIIGAICAILWNKIFLIAPIIFILTILGLHKKIIKPIFALIIICLFIISTLYTISREPKEDKLIYYDNKNTTLMKCCIFVSVLIFSGLIKKGAKP